MPLNEKIVQSECARSHIVTNFIRIPNLPLKCFYGNPGASASPFPPERLPLLLRVALESSGGVTTQTLHTEIFMFLVRNNVSCLLNDFPIQKTKTNVSFICTFFAWKQSSCSAAYFTVILPLGAITLRPAQNHYIILLLFHIILQYHGVQQGRSINLELGVVQPRHKE